MTIKTEHLWPPIPTRWYDWCAWKDGKEEEGPWGYGKTEEESIQSLRNKLDEDI